VFPSVFCYLGLGKRLLLYCCLRFTALCVFVARIVFLAWKYANAFGSCIASQTQSYRCELGGGKEV
jgi:hypothetical protein